MPKLMVTIDEKERIIFFEPGKTLKQILEGADIQIRAGCNGTGACGLCKIRIEDGEAGEIMPNERVYLEPAQLEQGIRLACQVTPSKDLQLSLMEPILLPNWRCLRSAASKDTIPVQIPEDSLLQDGKKSYGVAIDIGTTHIRLSLYAMDSGKWLCGRIGLNPQINRGLDVMTRLIMATESPKQADAIRFQLLEAIGEALQHMSVREGIVITQVVRMVLVGNTAMLTLLTAQNYEKLLTPAHWMRFIDCQPGDVKEWIDLWGLHPEARIDVMPPLAGFVGSDLLAGAMFTGVFESSPGNLLIDFGTNSEIALWDGKTLWVTSAAGGPAFEGSGISCGIPAEPGAIFEVDVGAETVGFSVINGMEPRGICGSGLVDLIAGLLRVENINCRGVFAPQIPKKGLCIVENGKNIVLTKGDIDLFQRAKAAVGAGIEVLLNKSGMKVEDLKHIYIGGSFGQHLNIKNAQQIGLLPETAPEIIELCGDMALAGCERALLLIDGVQQFQKLNEQSTIINLATCEDFEELFLENLYLQPLGGKR